MKSLDFRFSIFDFAASRRGLASSGPLALLAALTLALCVISWVLVAGLAGGGAGKMPAPQTAAWAAVGSQGEELGQFKQPRGISAFSDGSFVVADRAARVQFFARNGTPLRVWTMKEHSCGNPKGLCTLPDCNVLVCDTHYGRVLVLTPFGEIVKTWGTYGYAPGQFIHPLSAAVDAARGVAYIVEYGDRNDRVQRFALDGTFLKAWGSFGAEDGQFQRPSGVAVDAAGNVYVADACNHRIQAFDGQGGFLRSFGRMGRAPGELSYPYDIACGPDGLLYVAEFNNHRVSVFERGGKFVRAWGGPGSAPGQFANPWSLTVDSGGRLLVSDTGNHRVQIFNLGSLKPERGATLNSVPGVSTPNAHADR